MTPDLEKILMDLHFASLPLTKKEPKDQEMVIRTFADNYLKKLAVKYDPNPQIERINK